MTPTPPPAAAPPRRGLPWLSLALTAALAAGTLRARHRLAALPVLPAADPGDPAAPGPGAAGAWRMVCAPGVEPDIGTYLAASAYAEREGLRVLDLLPADLPAEHALGLLRLLDPPGHRHDPLGPGRSAGHAVLVERDLLARAGVAEEHRPQRHELLELVRTLKEYAPDATGLAVAPGLRCGPPRRDPDRAAELRAQGLPPRPLALAQAAGLCLLAGAAARQGRWGALAAGLYWLQPYAVLGGSGGPVRPADLARATAARPGRALAAAVRTFRGAGSRPRTAEDTARRERYRAELALGTDRFLEDRRPDCPWCGSERLAVRVQVPDLLQGKPGRFTLERCGDCGHTFQNPRLTPQGLDFYYRDFYDGTGGEGAGALFGRLGDSYRARAEMLRPYADSPGSWLDVGTGHGHFCVAARGVWPGTRFDGLDMGDGVRQAERRGWIARGFQGQFPEFADKLAGCYEVVSMYHYLEHTRDPLAELDAAATVLAPGGLLAIELPDPESRMAGLLGPLWLPWFQPQHQHLVPARGLREALADRGFTVLAEEHGPAHQGNDFVGAVALATTWLAPDPNSPWAAPAPPLRRLARRAVRAGALPCFAVAAALDGARTAAARRADGGNAYRMLARKDTP
ncbi:class I SAM-dependent methyltransferase [Streptomyces antimicrobicus]|uniref:Class I SAM-dependent methyltransferase n=1 Tax=Streptomyces antimicrobicus TaxID=2883108 RepID=A0ABS8BCN4_9ACTN|nr:class I SAM-dependent methyltransferase [Streptomyces antimicrobicus]MCB5182406.1 class I SAM-dependent methyltransferase [Streptomyces antimicrobicus]